MSDVPDQRPVWDRKHAAGDHEKLRSIPSPFAELAEPYFPRQARILELGCGIARDAIFFAAHGHQVLATDGSAVVIGQNEKQVKNPAIEFAELDMRQPLPYDAADFDVVYGNLSLHYYTDGVTREIVAEAGRVVKPGGLLAFGCKSYDSMHEEGTEIEPGVFTSSNGQTIHLFNIAYMKQLFEPLADIVHIDETEEEYNGRYSRIVRCIAKSKNS